MKHTQRFLLTGIAAILFISCQKEISEGTGGTPLDPPDTVSSVLLKKYIKLDTTLAAPNDTIFTASYLYDNAKRCTSILYKYFDHPDALYEGTVEEKIFYNGSDTNMSHRTMVNTYAAGTDRTAEYFTYDANGRVLRDSIDAIGNDASFYYRYDGNIIHTTAHFLPDIADTFLYTTHHIQKLNGNIITERDSAYEVNQPWPYGTPTVALTDAQYDNHPNPFYKLSPPWPVVFEIEHVLQDEWRVQQKNNWLRSYQEFDGWGAGESDLYTFQYTYLANGYPSIVRIKNTYGGDDHYFKGIYQYY